MQALSGIKKIIVITLVVAVMSSLFIGIMYNGERGNDKIAKVGRYYITGKAYERSYFNEINYIQNLLEQKLTEEQIKAFNVRQNVLNRMVNHELILNLAADLNLDVSDSSIAKQIAHIPYFLDQQGRFDKDQFEKILNDNNLSEAEYYNDIRKSILHNIISESIMSFPVGNMYLFDKVFMHSYETREADIINIPISEIIKNTAEPSESDITSYYEKNHQQFMTPEYRRGIYTIVDKNNIVEDIEISTKEIDEEFDNNRKTYTMFSRRDLTNIIFDSPKEASEYIAQINSNKNNEAPEQTRQIASVNEMKDADINDFPEDMRYAIWETPEAQLTPILKSPLGYHVIKINKIKELDEEGMQNIKNKIGEEIKERKSFDLFYEIIEHMEQSMQSNKDMSEIASEYNLVIKEIPPIASDMTAREDINIDIPDKNIIVHMLFESELNQHSSRAIDHIGEKYLLTITQEIIAPTLLSREQADKQIRTEWQNSAVEKYVELLTDKIIEKVEQAEDWTDLIEQNNLTIKTGQKLYRSDIAHYENPTQDYPMNMTEEIFAVQNHQCTRSYRHNTDNYTIACINKITEPDPNNPELQQNLMRLRQDIYRAQNHMASEAVSERMKNKFKLKFYRAITS